MKNRKKKVYDDDDGRVISSMNVDGMPWYWEDPTGRPDSQKREQKSPEDELQLTKKERRAMIGGVFAAALLIAGVFALAGFLFILFCVYVWLR